MALHDLDDVSTSVRGSGAVSLTRLLRYEVKPGPDVPAGVVHYEKSHRHYCVIQVHQNFYNKSQRSN